MNNPRRFSAFLLVACLLTAATPTTSVMAQTSLNGHTVQLDATGKLLAWPSVQANAYDQVLTLASNYLVSGVPTGSNGLKLYYSESYANPGNPVTGAGWPHNPAGLYSMLTESGLLYYAYSGNVAMANLVRDVLTYQLDHGMTPTTWNWPGVAYASADAGATTYSGASVGNAAGVGDGVGVIEPDKVGEIGVAFLKYYEFAGVTRFRDAAIQAADVLAGHVRTGSATQSPWPFRVYAETNNVREQYTAHVISPIQLFDELIRLNLGNVSAYRSARQIAWNWLMAYPMQNNAWAGYFEDVQIQSDTWNVNQLNAGETARYLMRHPEFDPNWETHVRGIIAWIESTFAVPQYGANSIAEQFAFFYPMGSHTSRYASLNAQLFELTGDQAAREKAYRSLNWATYMCGTNGVVIDGPGVNHIWWTDGYGDYIKHFMESLGSVPEWAPQTQSHLLRSTSVVRSIQYGATEITYQVFDPSAQEVLRLNFAPQSVTADGVLLPNTSTLAQQGWSFDSSTGVMRVRHDAGTQLRISGAPATGNTPPTIIFSGAAPGNYVTPISFTLAATASDSDGSIDHVEFLGNGTVLATSSAAPYRFTWAAVAGNHVLSAVAVDDRGARTTSNTVSIVVSSPTLPPAPASLAATVSGNTVSLTWAAPTSGPATASYRVYRSTTNGFAVGASSLIGQASAPTYSDSSLSGGVYYYRVVAVDASGNPGEASSQASAVVAGGLAVENMAFSDGSGARTSPPITTTTAGTLLLAFAAADGPRSGGQTLSITGGGLVWTLVARMNTQPGTSEIWKATASGKLTNATVTSTPSRTGYSQSLSVIAFAGAGGTGAFGAASGIGVPNVSLTTTSPGSLVYGIGNDWDRAVSRTVGTGQSIVHEWVDSSAGDTFWVQKRTLPVENAGTVVQLADPSPASDRWNLVAVEITSPGAPISAPNVVSQMLTSAQQQITAANLVVGTVTSQASLLPTNTVISQSPSASTQVAPGSAINLIISSGPQLVAVPNVTGQALTAAQSQITQANLLVGTVGTQPSTLAINTVITQSPLAGSQTAAGSAVNLIVSSGPQLVNVPNVVGQTQAAAQAQITGVTLAMGTVTSQPSTLPVNTVISQSPAAGVQIAAGSAVNLVISSGVQLVVVPGVVGQTQTAAQTQITGASLVVGAVTTQSSTLPINTVITQNPAAGTQAAAGSAVNLVVSSGSVGGSPTIDKSVFSDGSGTRTTAAFTTVAANELLVAFVASDGPSSGTQSLTVSGAGLTWTLVRRVNTQRGSSEIWRAIATNVLANATVTSTPAIAGYPQSLTVVTFRNASGVGASATANASTGAPAVSLTTTKANALVYGVGNDWDRAVARTLPATQTMVHQWVNSAVGDTFWVQAWSVPVAATGTAIRLNDTAPTGDRWNFAAVEIVP